jgi:hypothetical protein
VLPRGRSQIGKFGIGKLATYVLANRLSHISKKAGKYSVILKDAVEHVPRVRHLSGQVPRSHWHTQSVDQHLRFVVQISAMIQNAPGMEIPLVSVYADRQLTPKIAPPNDKRNEPESGASR